MTRRVAELTGRQTPPRLPLRKGEGEALPPFQGERKGLLNPARASTFHHIAYKILRQYASLLNNCHPEQSGGSLSVTNWPEIPHSDSEQQANLM